MEHVKEEFQQKSYATGMLLFAIFLALLAMLLWKGCGVALSGSEHASGHDGHKAEVPAENIKAE